MLRCTTTVTTHCTAVTPKNEPHKTPFRYPNKSTCPWVMQKKKKKVQPRLPRHTKAKIYGDGSKSTVTADCLKAACRPHWCTPQSRLLPACGKLQNKKKQKIHEKAANRIILYRIPVYPQEGIHGIILVWYSEYDTCSSLLNLLISWTKNEVLEEVLINSILQFCSCAWGLQ